MVETLLIAIVLVVLVVYLPPRPAGRVIPSLAIVVSLIGTFAFLYVVGFSLNLLSAFRLVLVIGTVVDNSIVVVEAVQAKVDEGYVSAYRATEDAMGGLTFGAVDDHDDRFHGRVHPRQLHGRHDRTRSTRNSD